MPEDLSTKACCIIDNGLFTELAPRLARSFGHVYYAMPWVSAYPRAASAYVGTGLAKNVERVLNFWDVIPEVDCVIFPDLYYAGEQRVIREQFKLPVWGHGDAERLELDRWGTRKLQRDLGIAAPPTKFISGLDALEEYLGTCKDKWVKISCHRGDGETFHHETPHATSTYLHYFRNKVGAMADEYEFMVEGAIDGIECYDKETEVLTNYGWMRFEELRPEYLVLTMNPKTRRIEYQLPTEYIKKKAQEICIVQRQKIDFAVTPNHTMLLSVGSRNLPPRFVTIKDVTGSQYTIHSDGEWEGAEVSQHTIPPLPDYFYNKQSRRLNCPIVANMDAWLEFLGWWLAEGCITRNSYTIAIAQAHVHAKEREAIRGCLRKLPFRWNENGINFRINSKQLYMHLLPWTRSGKRIPAYVKALCPRQIRILLDSFYAGDGTLATNGVTKIYCCGTDKRLADDIQECLLKSGTSGSVIRKKPQGDKICDGRKIFAGAVTWLVSEHKCADHTLLKSYIKTVPYDDWVYCVTVPNHTLYVRRNGKAMWCGNCGYDGWTVRGEYPSSAFWGFEVKDRGYIGKFAPYQEHPDPVRQVNAKFAPIFSREESSGFFSFEFRYNGDKVPYVIDPMTRAGSPPMEGTMEGYANLPEIMWDGAHGRIAAPEAAGKYVAIAMVHCAFALTNWVPISVSKEDRQWLKLRNPAVVGGKLYHVPIGGMEVPEIGAVVAVHDDLAEAIRLVKERAERIHGYELVIHTDALDAAQDEIKRAAEYGIIF